MLNISFQFFAHKKGGGSAVILNRRDSARSALTVSSFWLATSSFVREARTFIRATTLVSARTIRCSL